MSKLMEIERKIDGKSGESEQIEELQEVNSQLQQENTHLRAVNESLSGELQVATDKLRSEQQSIKEIKRLKEQIKEFEETVYDLKSKLIAATTENKQILESQHELYKDKESYRRDLQESHQKIDEEKTALEQKLRAIKKEAESSADRSQEAKAKLESMGMELTKARLETMHYQIENNQLLARLEAVNKQSPEVENYAKRVSEKIERLKELTQMVVVSPRTAEFVLEPDFGLSEEDRDVEEELIFEHERSGEFEDMDVDPQSLSGRLKNVFHSSLSSSFG